MKDIIIFGTARSGKTTFANFISDIYGYCIIPIDSFVDAFQNTFPDLGIKHKNTEFKFKNLPVFIANFYKKIKNDYPERNFIIEGWHVFPTELFKYLNKQDFITVCVGYPNQNPQEKVKLLKKYTYKNDYCQFMTDEELLKNTIHHIQYAKQLQQQCIQEDIKFFDLSNDWITAQNDLKHYICKLINEKNHH